MEETQHSDQELVVGRGKRVYALMALLVVVLIGAAVFQILDRQHLRVVVYRITDGDDLSVAPYDDLPGHCLLTDEDLLALDDEGLRGSLSFVACESWRRSASRQAHGRVIVIIRGPATLRHAAWAPDGGRLVIVQDEDGAWAETRVGTASGERIELIPDIFADLIVNLPGAGDDGRVVGAGRG